MKSNECVSLSTAVVLGDRSMNISKNKNTKKKNNDDNKVEHENITSSERRAEYIVDSFKPPLTLWSSPLNVLIDDYPKYSKSVGNQSLLSNALINFHELNNDININVDPSKSRNYIRNDDNEENNCRNNKWLQFNMIPDDTKFIHHEIVNKTSKVISKCISFTNMIEGCRGSGAAGGECIEKRNIVFQKQLVLETAGERIVDESVNSVIRGSKNALAHLGNNLYGETLSLARSTSVVFKNRRSISSSCIWALDRVIQHVDPRLLVQLATRSLKKDHHMNNFLNLCLMVMELSSNSGLENDTENKTICRIVPEDIHSKYYIELTKLIEEHTTADVNDSRRVGGGFGSAKRNILNSFPPISSVFYAQPISVSLNTALTVAKSLQNYVGENTFTSLPFVVRVADVVQFVCVNMERGVELMKTTPRILASDVVRRIAAGVDDDMSREKIENQRGRQNSKLGVITEIDIIQRVTKLEEDIRDESVYDVDINGEYKRSLVVNVLQYECISHTKNF